MDELITLLNVIDKKLTESMEKISSTLEKLDEIEDMSDSDDGKDEDVLADDEVTVIPAKKTLTKSPGQLKPFGYTRTRGGFNPQFGSYQNHPLRKSKTDFGPNPSFGPMAYPRYNPYFQ